MPVRPLLLRAAVAALVAAIAVACAALRRRRQRRLTGAALHPLHGSRARPPQPPGPSRSPTCAPSPATATTARRPTPTPARRPSSTRSTSCGCGSPRCPPRRSRSTDAHVTAACRRRHRQRDPLRPLRSRALQRVGDARAAHPEPHARPRPLARARRRLGRAPLRPGRLRRVVAAPPLLHQRPARDRDLREAGRRRRCPADPRHGRLGHAAAHEPLRWRRGRPAARDLPGRQPQPGRAAGARQTSARCAPRPGSSTARSPTSTCRCGGRCRASSRRRWSTTSSPTSSPGRCSPTRPTACSRGSRVRGEPYVARLRRGDPARRSIAPYYVHDAFPSLRMWERRESDWGLPNVRVDQPRLRGCARDDARDHDRERRRRRPCAGWAPRSAPSTPGATSPPPRSSARSSSGLRVSFARVAAEAHAYVTRLVLAGG